MISRSAHCTNILTSYDRIPLAETDVFQGSVHIQGRDSSNTLSILFACVNMNFKKMSED